MGKSIYFTDQEIHMIISYIEDATNILGEGIETAMQVDKDMENGLGSALRKLYKGKIGEDQYKKYKTKRSK